MNRSQQRARHHHCITMLESRQEMTSSKPENGSTAIQSGGQREGWMQDDMQIIPYFGGQQMAQQIKALSATPDDEFD